MDAAVIRLSRGFGVRFGGLDDAFENLRERIARACDERLRLTPVLARMDSDENRVSIDDGEKFEPFKDLVDRCVRRAVDLSDVRPSRTACR